MLLSWASRDGEARRDRSRRTGTASRHHQDGTPGQGGEADDGVEDDGMRLLDIDGERPGVHDPFGREEGNALDRQGDDAEEHEQYADHDEGSHDLAPCSE